MALDLNSVELRNFGLLTIDDGSFSGGGSPSPIPSDAANQTQVLFTAAIDMERTLEFTLANLLADQYTRVTRCDPSISTREAINGIATSYVAQLQVVQDYTDAAGTRFLFEGIAQGFNQELSQVWMSGGTKFSVVNAYVENCAVFHELDSAARHTFIDDIIARA